MNAVRPAAGGKSLRRVVINLAALALFAALAWAAWVAWQWAGQAAQRRTGEALFTGQQALSAHIDGHADALPVEASRCSNCHALGAMVANGVNGTNYGPNLHATGLTGAVARRGGPPSRYDEAAFCQLLRKGIDPAWVQIPRAMPRYALSSEQCRDLWAFLQTQ